MDVCACLCFAFSVLCTTEFRECREEGDAAKLAIMHEKLTRGVSQIRKYTYLQPQAGIWSVDMENDPLG